MNQAQLASLVAQIVAAYPDETPATARLWVDIALDVTDEPVNLALYAADRAEHEAQEAEYAARDAK